MPTRIETTLWVDTPAFEPWMLPTVTAWADEQTYPNQLNYIDEGNRMQAVKALQQPPSNPGSTAYVLTSVPHRRYWSCLPPWVHVLARNANNSPPVCTPEAWAYHWIAGRSWQNAKQWVGKPPKSEKLVALAADALQQWEELAPWDGRVEYLSPPLELDYSMVEDLPGSLDDYLGQIVGCDIETTGLNPYRDRILGVSISVREGQGWWIPFQEVGNVRTQQAGNGVEGDSGSVGGCGEGMESTGRGTRGDDQDSQEDARRPVTTCGTMQSDPPTSEEAAAAAEEGDSTGLSPALFHPPTQCPPTLRAVLASPAVAKVTHNGGFDWNFLDLHGVAMSPPAGDSKVLAYLLGLWPVSSKLTLKELAARLLRRPVITYGDAAGDEDTLATVDPAMLTTYAAQDADVCRSLFLFLLDKLATA